MEQPLPVQELSARDKRSLVFHLLYSADISDYEVLLPTIIAGYQEGFGYHIPLEADVVGIAQDIIDEREELDAIYRPFLSNWRFERVGVATKLILRYAVWEFLHAELDTLIIINEAIELAKGFAEKDAYKFINGILDEVSKKIRPEVAQEQSDAD